MPEKILIADDEQSIVVPLEFLMQQKGYRVMAAYNGEEAIEKIISFNPDLILLDIMLPIIDGFEVCQMIRSNPNWKDIKIIFVSAMGREVDIAKGLALGADAYITKPFANAEIIQKVREVLGH
ncbi:MAG: response regulator [Proteobacteria bacterium]|nr:response regulator [Pseudomonadota bacterium]MBU1397618.1 response regulator [Pseudomonadota bacterium]MBU1571244.1 response regulator [Pseudomonadota bacterium]MBU1713893.1 response regulator [Pseudomonadota bacterium]